MYYLGVIFQLVEKLVFRQAGRGRRSELKFVNRHAEAYVDTPSADWQKHKIVVISVKKRRF